MRKAATRQGKASTAETSSSCHHSIDNNNNINDTDVLEVEWDNVEVSLLSNECDDNKTSEYAFFNTKHLNHVNVVCVCLSVSC